MAIIALDVIVCILTVAVLYWLYIRSASVSYSSPPGPPGLPFLGNLYDVPSHEAWRKYVQWSCQYLSDIIRLNVFGTNIIVVNSLRAAIDLFDRRSTIYNDRPHMTMISDLIGMGWTLALLPYGERWRDMRKALHRDLNYDSVKQFRDVHIQACHEFLRRLVSRPERFREDIRHMTGRIILRVAYGIDVESENDRYIAFAEGATEAFSSTVNAGSYLVDSIPILRYLPEWFPGANFQRRARMWRPAVNDMLNEPFRFVKKRMLGDGALNECTATSLLESIPQSGKDPAYMEGVVKDTLATIYAAGADTTVAALASFFLAMTLYPEVQKKAQEAIDKVIGPERLPDFSDYESLPYITAIMNESLRWHPVISLNIPHRLSEDDVYNGYFLSKGSVIVGNSWAILHDELTYPDPSSFNPDRFMKDGKLNPDVLDPDTAAFGFGRRKCPGIHLVKESLWVSIASILASFTIEPAKGQNGEEIKPPEEYLPGLLSHPAPFTCAISPRTAKHEELIASTVHEEA
ncbi:unnamed protein product [Somion occarium]|uniref:Cytochrome P450 n=1 Tax=Somion occarium TaxID=3059160 RepID=A0ABP1E699_9APHY